MDVAVPADPQAAEPVQMGERALHDPALRTRAGAVRDPSTDDQRLHTEVTDEAAVLVVVIATVAPHHIGAAPGPASFAAHRRHGLEQWDQLGDAVAVAAGQGDGERHTGGVGWCLLPGRRDCVRS